MKTLLSLFFAAILLSSCGSGTDKSDKTINSEGVNSSSNQPLNNPAHGMPGHDCAIPEGAPLPQKGNAQQQSPTSFPPPVPSEHQSLPAETNKAVKLNPAHGMPGHRCEIAVGAPL